MPSLPSSTPAPSAPHLPKSSSPPPPSMFSSISETVEEVREAVYETDMAKAVAARLHTARRAASSAWKLSSKVAWILGTSALVLVVPLLYEIDKEIGPDAPAPQTPAAGDAPPKSS